MSIRNKEQYKSFCCENPDHSLLQDAEWGELKSGFGWTPAYVCTETAGAQVLFRKLPAGLTIAYIPRGPFGQDFKTLWPEIHALCRSRHAIYLCVEPDYWQGTPEAAALEYSMEGFVSAYRTIQPPSTILVSLEGSQEDWLARMNQKTRYNIRLSQKKDLTVEESDDVSVFHRLMETTGSRDEFSVHSESYYRKALDCFREGKKARIILVSYQGKPLSALMLFIEGKRGYYLYGASSNEERNRMPNHLAQWTAMNICKEAGCTEYDLWGIPDESEETLEAQFQDRHDGLWPVYRFKRGFGGSVMRTMGSFDYVYSPLLYKGIKFADEQRRKRGAQ
ncbi:MAG: peptidoglycan bridge formation glycyltransferase FemA/FemB family protein [Anaerolineaceae bacterium]|nr:peptidoglycan bridge formation glycyltransferase FemA/FemB family protein [Anaerolineaceae bacterium]